MRISDWSSDVCSSDLHQIDVEALGFAGPDVDAELIVMLARLWKRLGLADVRLELNSLGQPAERAAHRAALIEHLERHRDILDEDGQRRLYTNPLRVLDTKNPAMQAMADSAPRLFDFLGGESRAHFDGLSQLLADAGLEYRLNPRLVRDRKSTRLNSSHKCASRMPSIA